MTFHCLTFVLSSNSSLSTFSILSCPYPLIDTHSHKHKCHASHTLVFSQWPLVYQTRRKPAVREQTVKTDTQTTPSVPVRISDYVSLLSNEHQLNYNSEHSWCLCVHSLPRVSFLRKGKRVKVLLQSSPQMVDHPLSILIYFLLLFGSCCDFLQLHPEEKENVRKEEEKSKWGRESSKGERMRERGEERGRSQSVRCDFRECLSSLEFQSLAINSNGNAIQ